MVIIERPSEELTRLLSWDRRKARALQEDEGKSEGDYYLRFVTSLQNSGIAIDLVKIHYGPKTDRWRQDKFAKEFLTTYEVLATRYDTARQDVVLQFSLSEKDLGKLCALRLKEVEDKISSRKI